jgi:mono/diheme cytochrome c family protein
MRLTAQRILTIGAIGTIVTLCPVIASAASADAGKAVFMTKCKTCHGEDGAGNPAIAKVMKVEMKQLGGESDGDIKTAVTAGTGKMKPVTGVAGADLDSVIAYVHTLKK